MNSAQMKDMGKYWNAMLAKGMDQPNILMSCRYLVVFSYSSGMFCSNWILHYCLPRPKGRHNYVEHLDELD